MEKYTAYCVKCKAKVEIKNPEPYEMKGVRGIRNAIKGVCPVCNGKVFRIIKNKEE